jgi:hypothetical protein
MDILWISFNMRTAEIKWEESWIISGLKSSIIENISFYSYENMSLEYIGIFTV